MIAARLDQLPAPQRAIVDNAAVLGSADSIGALVRFAQAMRQEFRDSDLAELAADGLFDIEGRRWRFRSDVVREVAYQTLTKRIRAQRHAGVAAVLAGEHKDEVDDLAHHAAAAAELIVELGPVDGVPSSIVEKATKALLKAASVAVDAGRLSHAVRHASRALDLHPVDAETERRLLLVRATAEMDERMYPEAIADAQQVLDGALADGDRVHEAEARRRLGTIWQMQGDLEAARRELDCAVALFRELGEPGRLADGLRARGFAEVFGGSLTDARRFLDEAMEIYHEIADERGHAWTHQSLAWVAFQSGDFADAETQLLEAEERFEADRRPQRRQLGAGPARLRVVLPPAVRRRREVGGRRRERGPTVGPAVAGTDDADAAVQPAPLDRPAGRGRTARRAGTRRLPGDERPVRDHAGAVAVEPGPRRPGQEG